MGILTRASAEAISKDNWWKETEERIGFVQPTFVEYLKYKFALPTWKEARTWSVLRMGGGPMTEVEYAGYLNMTDDMEWNKKNADSINRLRSRTTFGWYLSGWADFVKRVCTFSYSNFVEMKFDEALQSHLDQKEYARQSYSSTETSDDWDDWATEDLRETQYDYMANEDES